MKEILHCKDGKETSTFYVLCCVLRRVTYDSMPAEAALRDKSNVDYMAIMERKYISPNFDFDYRDVIVVDPTTETMMSRHQVDIEGLMLKPVPSE